MEAVVRTDNLREKLASLTKPVSELEEGMLVSATYDGDLRVAVLKFYEPKTGQIRLWRDNTGHKPYCYTKLERQELEVVGRRNDVLGIEEAEKADLLSDTMIKVRKIVATDPLAIGGGQNSVRDQIRAWEADIKYFENYAYDKGFRMGTYYRISGGKVLPLKLDTPEIVTKSLEEIFRRNPPEFGPYLKEWAELLGQPLPDFKRIALDIEVANEENRVPDSDSADLPVIAVSFFNEYEKIVYLLAKENKEMVEPPNAEFRTVIFHDEKTLLRAALSKVMEYPVIITFNGDDFDLRYLKHRAERGEIGIREEENPITLERVAATLKHGIHIDLYQFFRNRSIQVYAFSNKYTEHTLNGIAEVLLGKSKIEFEGNVGDLPLLELANYCFNDAELTYGLTSMSGSVVMKLLVVLARIGKMPVNDVSRLGVSNWIRSMLFYEHRKINALIPRQDELSEKGGASSQSIIKGKKYKGGLVIEPKPGVYFDVSVLDFASLYPSLIKVQNLSYETVNCPHEECRKNIVPETTHWVCSRRKGITSLVTGSLRDLRVSHYKPLSKIPTLSKEERDLYNIVSQGLKVILNACFSGDTELVTPEGIKNIKEFKVGDRVVTVNPESLEPEIDEVVDVQAFDYNGDLYHFRDKRFVDLLVTPNHRFLTLDRRGESSTGVVFRTAEEIYHGTNMTIPKLKSPTVSGTPPRISILKTARGLHADVHLFPNGRRLSSWFRTLEPDLRSKIRAVGTVHKQKSKVNEGWGSHYTLPSSEISEEDLDDVERAGGFVLVSEKRSSKVPVRFDGERFAALCGWFVSEGSLYSTTPREYPTGARRGRSEGLVISQSYGKGNPRGLIYRGKIADLLSGLGLRGRSDSEDRKYFKVASGILHEWTLANCYSEGVNSHKASSKRIPRFVFASVQTMRAFLESAYMGDGSAKQVCYSTTSESLAKDMVVLLSLLGAKSKIKWDNGIYRLTFKNVSSKLTYSGDQIHKYVTRFPYEGKVYCVTTAKNHTVVAGRNGRFVQVGQSYGVMGFETFAFYCLPVAEATAAFGRNAITKTIEQCTSHGVNVIYSDSVTRERCVTLLDPNGLLNVLPIEEFFKMFAPIVRREDGKELVQPVNWKALSVDPNSGAVSFKPIKAVIRHETRKRIYHVWDKWGDTRVTEDHSLLAAQDGKLVFAKPTDLLGKHLVRAASVPPTGNVLAVDVYDAMKSFSYESRYKGRRKHLHAQCDDRWVWFSWTNRRNPIRVRRFILVGTPEFRALVELLGAYVAEGSASTPETARSRYGATISCSERQWLSQLRDDYLKLFDGAKPGIIASAKGTRNLTYRTGGGELVEVEYEDATHKLNMKNELSAVFFRAFCGQKSDGKQFPSFIFNLPEEYKLLFLENLVKGDGSRVFGPAYSGEYRRKNFRLETKSHRMASGLSVILSQLGIGHTIRYRPSKATYCFATSTRYNERMSPPNVEEEDYEGFVYDLSVEDNHTFVDSCGNVVLKNTDSLFLHSPTTEQVSTVTHWAEKELGIELELDKNYRYIAFSSRKKNYFGVLPDGTPDIKGLTGKKSQTPEFLKKTFYAALDILGSVQSSADFERARGSIRELLTTMILRLRNRSIPIEELAFNVMIGKPTRGYSENTPQHVKAAQLLEKIGREIKAGDIISYVKTRTPPFVKPASLAKADEIDEEKYIEYAHSMFDQMLDALDFSFDEIMGATTLDLFWS